MQKVLGFVVILLTTLSSFSKSLSQIDGKFVTKKIGEYTIILSQDFESGLGKITIQQRLEKVFEESGIDNHYSFGNDFDGLKNKDPYSGHDLDGSGFPNLVISNWTGGAHCCHFLYIFELGKAIKEIARVDAHSSSIRLADLDHDALPEIEFWDGAIDYSFASFAGSPGGRVVLKLQNGQYEVAPQLMKMPAPSTTQIMHIKNKIKTAFKTENSSDLPYDFLSSMMDLSYSGHLDLAMKIATEVWPLKKPGLAQFKKDFAEALNDSFYWKSFFDRP